MTEQAGTFKDPTGLTKWVRWSLYLQVVIAVVAVGSGALEYQLLNDFRSGVYSSQSQAVAAGQASDARQSVVATIQVIVFLLSGILILRWIHRANFNARQLGAAGMEFTPGWCVGWYFVPIANLWKPYQAMKEIWKASSNPEDWKDRAVPSLLGWWWFFWVASNMLGNVSFRMTLEANELDGYIAANVVTQLSDATWIPVCLVFLGIVGRVHDMQMAQFGRAA